MRRLERLVNLLAALIETDKPLSAAELQERVPGYPSEKEKMSFRRALERDKETLRSMGLPLITEPLDVNYPDYGDGYRIPRDQYALPDPGLTPKEMQALAMAASAVKLKSQAATAALWKLGGDPNSVTTVADVQLTDDDRLGQVFTARNERRRMTFQYRETMRELEPQRVSFRNGHWYVSGFDRGRLENRTYRLDRMDGNIELSQANAYQPTAVATSPWLPSWQLGDEPCTQVRVLIDASQASIAEQQVDVSNVEERRPDGSIVLKLDVTNREALRSFVLGFLDHAEILSPQDLRDEFRTYVHSFVKQAS